MGMANLTANDVNQILAYSKRTIAELRHTLTLMDIEWTTDAGKADLIAVIMQNRGEWKPSPKPDNSDIMAKIAMRTYNATNGDDFVDAVKVHEYDANTMI